MGKSDFGSVVLFVSRQSFRDWWHTLISYRCYGFLLICHGLSLKVVQQKLGMLPIAKRLMAKEMYHRTKITFSELNNLYIQVITLVAVKLSLGN